MTREEKIYQPKTLKIEETTLKKIKRLKVDLNKVNYSEVLDYLLEWYEWWKQPGPGRGKGKGKNENN